MELTTELGLVKLDLLGFELDFLESFFSFSTYH